VTLFGQKLQLNKNNNELLKRDGIRQIQKINADNSDTRESQCR